MTTQELREMLARATPEPWSFDQGDETGTAEFYQPLIDRGPRVFGVHSYRMGDVALICAAVNALPALLDVVEAAKAVRCNHHRIHSFDGSSMCAICDPLTDALSRLASVPHAR